MMITDAKPTIGSFDVSHEDIEENLKAREKIEKGLLGIDDPATGSSGTAAAVDSNSSNSASNSNTGNSASSVPVAVDDSPSLFSLIADFFG